MANYKIVETERLGDFTALKCPRCGSLYLHHAGVIAYDRVEDAAETVVTKTAGSLLERRCGASKGSGNPSGRRDGIVIRFACENCRPELELTIAQCKGMTEIEWRFD